VKKFLIIFILFFSFHKNEAQTPLLNAIEKNDTAAFDRILRSGYNVNRRKKTIQTRYSIPRKRKLNNGKIIDNKRMRKQTPIIHFFHSDRPLTDAAQNGNYYFVKRLLEEGAKPSKKGSIVLPPLAWAAHMGHFEIVKLLLENGADINGSEKKWRTTPLIEAIEWKRWDVAKYLIEKANIHLTDKEGKTALSHAAVQKNFEIVRLLVDKGADINHTDKEDMCILEEACGSYKLFAESKTNLEVIKFLVEHGAGTSNSAINMVLSKGEFEIAKYLLANGAPIKDKLLLSASNGKNFEMFRYLVDSLKLDIITSKGNDDKENVLHGVCQGFWGDSSIGKINIPMLEYMLKRGVNVNDTNSQGQTPICLLFSNGKKDNYTKAAIELLIKYGANVNISGGDLNFSPLMSAASDNLFETAKLLIENGADVNYKDDENRTILHWAAWQHKNEKVIELLVKHGANINAIDNRGQTPAMSCITFNRWENIQKLVELNTDLTIKDKLGFTLLDHVYDEKTREMIIKNGGKSGKE